MAFCQAGKPSFSEPDFDLWVRDFGKILHHDYRDFVEVSELISWIFESKSFWTCHVLTPSALRKFYERILARKNYETNRKKGESKSFFEELESQGFEAYVKIKYINALGFMSLCNFINTSAYLRRGYYSTLQFICRTKRSRFNFD